MFKHKVGGSLLPKCLKIVVVATAIFSFLSTTTQSALAVDAQQLLTMLPSGVSLRPEITTPESYLGWEIGTRHVRHHEVVGYAKRLCEESDRLTWLSYGQTWDHRPLGVVVVGRADRQSKDQLDAIAAARREWAFGDGDDNRNKQDGVAKAAMPPSVAWLGYSIHGDESSATNSSLLVLYVLAAAQGEWVDAILDRHLLLIDPSLNPDGLDRFASWVNDHRGLHPSSDPADIEHQQGWPHGRGNHYNFDLNRDWLPATQPESQGRLRLYHEWLPNLVLDFHEMGSDQSLFFQPGIEGRDHPMTPAFVREITQGFAKRYAAVTDAAAERYYTQERYDDFYPGKGSTYPDLHGSVGILVEQGSTRGLIHDYASSQRTFEQTILNPFRLSLASIEGLHRYDRELMEYQRSFYGQDRRRRLSKQPKGFLLEIPTDHRVRAEFLSWSEIHHLRLFALNRNIELDGKTFQADQWWLAPSDQPHGLFLQAIMDRTKQFAFDKFYDISAWNMPDAFGIDWQPIRSDFDAEILKAIESPKAETKITLDRDAVAIAVPGRDVHSMALMYELMNKGLVVRIAKEEARVAGAKEKMIELTAASCLFHRADQSSTWSQCCEQIESAVNTRHLSAISIMSSLTDKGPDLGSENFPRLVTPRLAMLVGDGTSFTEAGGLWFTLDRLLSLPVSRLEPNQLKSDSLRRFNTLLIPEGEQSRLNDEATTVLREWMRHGGHAVLLGGAVAHLGRLAEVKEVDFEPPQVVLKESNGFILETAAVGTSMLKKALGEQKINVFQSESIWPISSPVVPILKTTATPLVAGYLSEADHGKVVSRTVMGTTRVGKGRITAITFNPTFRGHYWGTIGLLREVIFREAD